MGKSRSAESASKFAARGVRIKTITNYELRITDFVQLFVVLCLLCAFAGNSFAQNPENPDTSKYFIIDEKELRLFELQSQIKDANVEGKRDALLKIRNLESAEFSRLAVPALRDSSEIVRATAAFSVIYLPKEEAAPALLPLLNDKSAFVRREAAYALGKVGNSSAVNSLLEILQKDKILEVRSAAAIALGEIGDVDAVDALTQVLQKKSKAEDEFLRRSAARSIGQIAQIILSGETEVITPADFSSKEIDKPKRANLAETFPSFRAAVGVLIQTLQNPKEFPDVKREAAFALGAIGDKAAIPVLQANLNSEDYYLAEICREALRKISA
jgi:HEAT repeat protein